MDVLRSDWLTTGPTVPAFETAFANAVGAPHAVACSSGTAGLHLATLALGLGPGDWAIVPSVTFLATANAVRYVGAEVAFADVDPNTGLMTAETLQAAAARCGGPIKAVLPVHLAGPTVDLSAISSICADFGAVVMEDACHALGGRSSEESTVGDCTYSALAVFSLHPVKMVAAGEGGVITTGNEELTRRLRIFRNHGIVRSGFINEDLATDAAGKANPWYYEMHEPGFNYRLSDIHAALAHSQLKRLHSFVERRAALVDRYNHLLASLAPAVRSSPAYTFARSGGAGSGRIGWHLFVALFDFQRIGKDRAAVMAGLRDRGIGTQVHYVPVHHQPYFRNRYGALDLPGADRWYAQALSLPLFPDMVETDVDRVVAAVTEVIGG